MWALLGISLSNFCAGMFSSGNGRSPENRCRMQGVADRTDLRESMKQLKVTVNGIGQPDAVHWKNAEARCFRENAAWSRCGT